VTWPATTDLEQAPTTRSRLGCADWAAPSPDSHAPWHGRALPAKIDELEAEITELVKHPCAVAAGDLRMWPADRGEDPR
jgi:hypothetical protein